MPSAVASLPEDRRNTARETRARYRYQDECAAMTLLNHLGSDDLDGVLIEHSTDLILLPANGVPELVSIKHREPNQTGEPGWSWNALKRQSVLIDLYHAWNAAERRCTLAFWTNASFNGSTHRLWQVCARQEEPTQDLLRSLGAQLGVSRPDVEAFLAALTIPENPLPRRKEITDIGVRRTTDLLQKHRPGFPLNAEECYRALVDRIAKAGTDVPEAEALSEANRRRYACGRCRPQPGPAHASLSWRHVNSLTNCSLSTIASQLHPCLTQDNMAGNRTPNSLAGQIFSASWTSFCGLVCRWRSPPL